MPRTTLSSRIERIKGKEIKFDTMAIGGNDEVYVDHDNLQELENFYQHLQTQSEFTDENIITESSETYNNQNGMCTPCDEGCSPPVLRRNLSKRTSLNIEITNNVDKLQETIVDISDTDTSPTSVTSPSSPGSISDTIIPLTVDNSITNLVPNTEKGEKVTYMSLTHLSWFSKPPNDIDKTKNESSNDNGYVCKSKTGILWGNTGNLSNTTILALLIVILMIIAVIVLVLIAKTQRVTEQQGRNFKTKYALSILHKYSIHLISINITLKMLNILLF